MAIDTLTHEIDRTLRGRGFTGDLVTPGLPTYQEARRVWNGSIDRWPAGVARCHDAEDVAAVIGGATRLGLPLAVRGGGHSVAGHSTCDDGVVLDLSPMRQVAIDPVTRRARVAGGALLGDLDRAAQEHGLAVPAGQVSHTGVAGLTLGGGVGYLMRPLGLTIDSLRSASVVTSAGEQVRASEDQNPDLFWALRGGGENFGVVTEFEFDLHPVGPIVYAGVLVFPLERGGEVLRASRAPRQHGRRASAALQNCFLPPVTYPGHPRQLRSGNRARHAPGVIPMRQLAVEARFRGGEQALGVLVEVGEPLDHLSGDAPLAVYRTDPPRVKAVPGELFAHRGGRLPTTQEEAKPGAGLDRALGVVPVDQLFDLVPLIEEARALR
jgi:FAD/FMN-containing dehydrogenase